MPERTSPSEALPDILERVVSRRQIHPQIGDVLITRERPPLLNSASAFLPPWRYRVAFFGTPSNTGHTFTSFAHAASEAEQLASESRRRVIYIEDESPSVLADYRG